MQSNNQPDSPIMHISFYMKFSGLLWKHESTPLSIVIFCRIVFHCHAVRVLYVACSITEYCIPPNSPDYVVCCIWHMRYTIYRWLLCPLYSVSSYQHILPLYFAYYYKNEVFAKQGWLLCCFPMGEILYIIVVVVGGSRFVISILPLIFVWYVRYVLMCLI
jgi:hypothetical protein